MNPCHVVDVFASSPLRGNPVMVVLIDDDDDLTAARMQAFAAWNGMPETVYLRALTTARDAYAARIFSPRGELAFAGHPSLGAAHVAFEAGLLAGLSFAGDGDDPGEAATVWQHGAAEAVELRLRRLPAGEMLAFVKTPVPAGVVPLPVDDARAVAKAIGHAGVIEAYHVATGAQWLVARLAHAAELTALRPDMPAIEALSIARGAAGITVYAPLVDGGDASFELRSFGPAIGVPEDAVCGSGNACVAALQHHLEGRIRPLGYTAAQGRFVGRAGRIQIRGPVEDQRFWIGGSTRTMMSGQVEL
jgi:PhzF family phenazine biosynthesis protein